MGRPGSRSQHGKDSSIKTVGTNPYLLPYRTAFFDIFLDHEGYPGVKTPWGTLNAIDLNTGTDSYGGAIVTENGLLLIAATTYDNKFRAYNKRTGRLLW